jgi:polyhydroxyalkanoate synthesis repressor PhaR
MADEPVVIRKYENRRLYDTAASRYVNLEDVARLVREGRDLRVVDARSGEDVTRLVLAQIILEEARAEGGETGVPLDFLREIIRASDRATRDVLQWSLALALEQSKKLGTLSFWPWNAGAAPTGTAGVEPTPATEAPPPADASVEGPPEPQPTAEAPAAATAPPPGNERSVEAEMVDLKRRLAQLESRVARERRRRRKRERDA